MKIIDLGDRERTHREIGQALGEILRNEIAYNLEGFYAWLKKAGRKPDISEIMRRWTKVAGYFQSYAEELEGIARGSGIGLEELLSFMFEEDGGCTTLVVNPKNPILGHNEEWTDSELYVLRATPIGKSRILGVGYAGQLVGTVVGLNDKGMAFGADSVDTKINSNGIPKVLLLRSLLEAGSIDEAVKIATFMQRTVGNSCMFASYPERRIAYLEWSPYNYQLTSGDRLAHTGHFIGDRMVGLESSVPPYSKMRLETVSRLLEELTNPTLRDMMRILGYHPDQPDRTGFHSICCHGRDDPKGAVSTIGSFLVVPGEGILYATVNAPCQRLYEKYSI